MMRPYRPLVLAGFVGVVLMAWAGWTRSPQALMGILALSLLLLVRPRGACRAPPRA